jgi:hypothetical protein
MGFVIIEKYNKTHYIGENLLNRKPNINIGIGEILLKYNGFEGSFIVIRNSTNKYFENLGEITEFNKYLEYYTLTNNKYINFLYLDYKHNNTPDIIQKNFNFIGFEYGYCMNEHIVYSSIFNEIIFGITEELIKYKSNLNNNLLFSTKDIAISYKELHGDLYKKNVGVERDEDMKIYEIWRYKR